MSMVVGLDTKRCTGPCGRDLPLSMFSIKVQLTGQRRARCTDCRRVEYPNKERQYNLARKSANRATLRERQKKRRAEVRRQVLEHYGGCCACCGQDDLRFLTLDHINGGGRKHRQRDGSNQFYTVLREGYPVGVYQVLCYNCNCARAVYGECPHRL